MNYRNKVTEIMDNTLAEGITSQRTLFSTPEKIFDHYEKYLPVLVKDCRLASKKYAEIEGYASVEERGLCKRAVSRRKTYLRRAIRRYLYSWLESRKNGKIKITRKAKLIKEHLYEILDGEHDRASIAVTYGEVYASFVRDTINSTPMNKFRKELLNEENNKIEVKKSLALHAAIGETVSAFSNTLGGKIIVGLEEIRKSKSSNANLLKINDSYFAVGLEGNIDQSRMNLVSHLREKSNIDINDLIFENELLGSKRLLIISIPPVMNLQKKLIFYKGNAYIRVDSQTQRLVPQEVYELTLRMLSEKQTGSVKRV